METLEILAAIVGIVGLILCAVVGIYAAIIIGDIE